jgi:hypothetical protein
MSMGDRMAVNQPHAIMKKTAIETERGNCKPKASMERITAGAATVQMNVTPTRKANAIVRMPATNPGNQRRRKNI